LSRGGKEPPERGFLGGLADLQAQSWTMARDDLRLRNAAKRRPANPNAITEQTRFARLQAQRSTPRSHRKF